MIQRNIGISLQRQCEILNIHRSGLYYTPSAESDENLRILRMMDEQYLRTPFYGIRRMREWLKEKGFSINRKRVKRLMTVMDWQTLYRKPNTSWKNIKHPIYPYLLKNLTINRANQVWGIDITYIPMRRGFLYLCAIIDLHTRYVINWSINNTMSAAWCRDIVQEAINIHGKPEIINSDQGSQFTSFEYIHLLQENEITISMDGKGRAIDNIFIERLWKSVKYECVYLNVFEDGVQLYEGIRNYFQFYNHERLHQSLGYKTPAAFYKSAA
jgi:putative transposase